MTITNFPLVSVVMPVYNRSHIIARALDSVVNQTYNNFEVIVVDDCSSDSDDLVKVLERYKKKVHVIYIRHERNKHGGAARNTGIECSSGKYVAFLDSDDAWKKHKLERSIEQLEAYGVGFVYSRLEKIGLQVGVFPKTSLQPNERYSDYLLVKGESMQTSTLVVRRDLLECIRFDESLVRFQDYDLIISLEQADVSVYFIDEVLTTMFDDDQHNRISNSHNPEPAISWIEKIKHKISPEAYACFILDRVVKYLVYSNKKYQAKGYLSQKAVVCHAPTSKLIKCYLLFLTPCSLFPFLRYVAGKVKKTGVLDGL